jgi:hypothetical protein
VDERAVSVSLDETNSEVDVEVVISSADELVVVASSAEELTDVVSGRRLVEES